MSTTPSATPQPIVAIVAPTASARFGGEAILPLHWFIRLRSRGIDAWLVTHERTRDELATVLGPDIARVRFVKDTRLHRALNAIGAKLPGKIGAAVKAPIVFDSQRQARTIVRELVHTNGVNLVHQPTPVSPRQPSLLHGVGAPVLIGPMNGGMEYPPAFRHWNRRSENLFVPVARAFTGMINWLLPGKRRATLLLVANERTRLALPKTKVPVIELVENGVDLSIFGINEIESRVGEPVRFLYAGRLQKLKAIDLLLHTWKKFHDSFRETHPTGAFLRIIGDGPERDRLMQLAHEQNLGTSVFWDRFVPQARVAEAMRQADVFVLPSLHECGGAVALEAMACGTPVIAMNWGGPADYIDPSCGVLIEPMSQDAVVDGLAREMARLGGDRELLIRMAHAGRAKVERLFDWDRKLDRMLEIYRSVLAHG
ncbi:MAG: glycosyltransferase family 4 protein [Tepidisphaeraceae bacterium]